MTQREIRKQIQQLIATNQISEPAILSIPEFEVTDLYPVMYQHFNVEAIKALSVQTHNVIHQYNKFHPGEAPKYNLGNLLEKLSISDGSLLMNNTYTREAAKVLYFGFVASKDKVGEAALSLIAEINKLATTNAILASLSKLNLIKIYRMETDTYDYVIVSYLAIDQQYESLVQSQYSHCMFEEGGLPPEFK